MPFFLKGWFKHWSAVIQAASTPVQLVALGMLVLGLVELLQFGSQGPWAIVIGFTILAATIAALTWMAFHQAPAQNEPLERGRGVLAQSSNPSTQASESELRAIGQAARDLSDPIVDLIGLTLLLTKSAARVEKLVQAVIDARFGKEEYLSPLLISNLRSSVEKALATLQALQYVNAKDNEYELTDAGRLVFQRVEGHESEVIARYKYDI